VLGEFVRFGYIWYFWVLDYWLVWYTFVLFCLVIGIGVGCGLFVFSMGLYNSV